LLANGIKIYEGHTENVISQYLSEKLLLIGENYWDDKDQENNKIVVLSASCTDSENNVKDTFQVTEDIYLNFFYKTKQGNLKFIHGINIHDDQERNIFDSHDTTSTAKKITRKENEVFHTRCIIPKNLLGEGIFSVSFALFFAEPFILYSHQIGILRFKIIDIIDGTSARGEYVGNFPGIVRPLLKWSLISIKGNEFQSKSYQ
jgi:lipopolysaccharide transport system ATP-binding protein